MTSVTVTREIEIPFENETLRAFEAAPSKGDPLAPVLVIHEWWGLNAHIRDVAERLASEGFVALAPDLFGGKVTKDPSVAGSMMTSLDEGRALRKLSTAIESVAGHTKRTRSAKCGVIGFCMGGSYALLLPINDKRIGAAVPFYGQVPGDDALAGLKVPALFISAGRDQWITKDEIDRLEAYLKRSGVAGQVMRYPGADHAFFNDTRPEVYRREDAADAWRRAVDFLRSNLEP